MSAMGSYSERRFLMQNRRIAAGTLSAQFRKFLLSYMAIIGLILRDETDRSPRYKFPRRATRDRGRATPPLGQNGSSGWVLAARLFFYSCTVVQVVQAKRQGAPFIHRKPSPRRRPGPNQRCCTAPLAG